MSSILTAIGSWISGAFIPGVVDFFVAGVKIAASLVGSYIGGLLLIVFAIALITAAVIAYYNGFFESVEKNYDNTQIVDKDQVFKQLNEHKGEAATIETNLTFFDKNISEDVNKLLIQEKVEKNKASLMSIFINSILSIISKAKKGGENSIRKNYNLHENGLAMLYFKYIKSENTIILSFTFYDGKIFEYLKYLIKMLNKKGYDLENKNYENDLQNFQINEEDSNLFKIKIKNV